MNKILRKMIAILLIFCIVSSMCGMASATAFNDVSSSLMERPYFDAINYVSDRGIMEGYTNGSFLPNTGSTRAMIVVTLFRLSGDTGIYNQASQFTDVPSNVYYYNAVGWAVAKGITTGVTATEFNPNRIVTWAEFFTFLFRYAGYKDLPQDANESITNASDYSSVGSWAREPISWAYTYGMLLRSNPSALIYPNTNLNRKTLALFLARFRKNVEGIVWERDRFGFRNRYLDLVSGVTRENKNDNIPSRYFISQNDYDLLCDSARSLPRSNFFLGRLETARKEEWSGSCFGFALAVVLDNYGKVNLSGNCAIGCDTLYNIPAPSDVQNEKHIQVIDSVSDPHVNIADIESKINMYQLFQQLPVLLNNEEDIAPDPELRKLEAGQRHSGIALLTYQFDEYNTKTHETETFGHALVVYGKPIATYNGFKVKVYDCRKNDECWIEVNTCANKWTGYVTGTGFSEYIKNCRYRNDFEVFNNYLDFDGAANSLNTPRASLSMQNDSAVEIADSLSGKTILQVTTNDIFQISNEEGQSFTFEDGTPIGNMPVYGVDFIVDGMKPSPLVFLVDDSSSFTCTAIGENAEIRAFAVIGGGASGEAQVEKSDGSSWKSVRIDDIGEIHTVGSSSQ